MNKLTVLPVSVIGSILAFSSAVYAENEPGISFQLGAGVVTQPVYEGSSDDETKGRIKGSFNYITLGNGKTFSNDGKRIMGLSFAPSFGYVTEREASDHTRLTGLPDVDATFELGGKVRYATQAFDVFATARRGVNGHKGMVAELGVDVYWQPSKQFTLTAGPRVNFANTRYMNTYFGVSPQASATSGLAAFNADSGLKSTGFEVNANYQLNKAWSVVGELRYDKFNDRVTDSPIVQGDDAFRAELGLERRFDIRF